MKDSSRSSNYLFDATESKVSMTDKPRPAPHRFHPFFAAEGIENSSESVAKRPDPNQIIFSHFNPYRRFWEYLVFIVSASTFLEVSFVPIFIEKFPYWAIFPELLCDIIFIIDLFVVLHTSYLSHGVLIYDKSKIFNHYGKSAVVIHILASLPISWTAAFFRGWKTYSLLFFTRLLRLKRAVHASETLTRTLIYHSWKSVFTPTLFLLLSLIHLFACLFYLCALFEGLENSWVAMLGWDYLSPSQHYIVSVYFVLTTILTIGFGDMTPQTSSETILVIFIQLFGVFSNAYIIGMFVSFIMDKIQATFLNNYKSLVDFLEFKSTPRALKNEITNYFQYKWEENHGADDPNTVYKFVPETIRNHLKMDMCLESLQKVEMFRLATQNFRISLANILRTKEYVPGEIIFKQGDIINSIVLIKSGVVDVFIDERKFTSTRSEAFGDLELLVDTPRRMTAQAVTHVSGWTLSREDFQIAIGSVPDLKNEALTLVNMLFPHYLERTRKLLSANAIDLLMKQNLGSEYSDDSDIAVKMQNSSDSESDFNMI